MRVYKLNEISDLLYRDLIGRKNTDFDSASDTVRPILQDIKSNSIEAVLKYAGRFDGFRGGADDILITDNEMQSAINNLDDDVKNAIQKAYINIYKFHKEQLPADYQTEISDGITCCRKAKPIENVALYIPGGTAVLPSTVLMLGIPAKIAGCKRIVLISPARKDKIDDAVLYAANLCGIKEIYKIGGVQGIGMMAYGTESVPKVDKIFGPGNQFVNAAKMLVSIDPQGCSIDMPAGPSEVLIIADETANPVFVAADFLSQLEHGNDSQAVLVTDSVILIKNVIAEINRQAGYLKREEYINNSLSASFGILTANMEEAIQFSNNYAPEHLIISTKNEMDIVAKISNAGSVFVGQYSPESAGDYASGTNHSLPTSSYAKVTGGIGVESFMKFITYQRLTKKGLESISDSILKLAEVENLDAHANAVKVRLENDK